MAEIRADQLLMEKPEPTPQNVKGMRADAFLSLQDQPTEDVFVKFSPEEEERFMRMGKMGAVETAMRKDQVGIIPFIGGVKRGVEMISLMNAANRLQADDYDGMEDYKAKDIQVLNEYLRTKEEERIRGRTIPGKITSGVMELPAFMLEMLATGGFAGAGRKGTEKAVMKVAGKAATKVAGKVAKATAGLATSATIRTGLTPYKLAEGFGRRQLESDLALTEKGWKILEQGTEKPMTSFLKTFGDVWVEYFSEDTGAYLTAGAKGVVSKLPPRYVSAITKAFKRLRPTDKISTLFTKAGYNGFIEELGEERVGALMRAVMNIEDFGAENPGSMIDRILSSVPTMEEALVEAGILAFPGTAQAGIRATVSQLRKVRAQQKAKAVTTPEELTDQAVEAALAEGEQKTGYHGSPVAADITELKPSKQGELGEGVYFSKDKKQAEKFLFPIPDGQAGKAGVVEIDISSLKLKEMTKEEYLAQRSKYFDAVKTTEAEWNGTKYDEAMNNMRDDLIAQGYDGIYIEGEQQGVVFPGSIKKAAIKKEAPADSSFNFGANVKENVKPDAVKKQSPLDKAIARMTERLEKVEVAKQALEEGKKIADHLKGRVKRYAKGFMKEEMDLFPKGFFTTKKNAMTLDEALEDINNAGLGVTFANESELAEFLNNWQDQKAKLKEVIEKNRPKMITKKETTILKEKIADIERGKREGKRMTKSEVKRIQGEVIKMLNGSRLDKADRGAFLNTMRAAQTEADLEKALPDIMRKIDRLYKIRKSREIRQKIKKELKYTKPRKQAGVTVGKYDYQTNKVFSKIRELAKLTQTKALDALNLTIDQEAQTEADAITQRFLSLQANGADASLQMHEKVLQDIQRLKELGKEAKSEQDFTRALERENEVDEMVQKIDMLKGDKNTIKTKIGNLYRKGFSNIYSMINSLMGKKLAEQYNPELAENARDTAVFLKMKEAVAGAAARLQIKVDAFSEALTKMAAEKWELIDFEGLKTEVSRLELLDIYNSLKNEAVRERYYNSFGQAQIDTLVGNLTSQEVAFADYMQEMVQEYYEVHNQRSIELRNIDLGRVENYWMATSEHHVDVSEDIRIQGETPSAQKARATGKVIPIPKNAWLKFQKHISQGEHARHLSADFIKLKKRFSNRRVKNYIENRYGADVYRVLMNQIDMISLNKQTEQIDMVTDMIGKMLNNWVTAKVALSPSVFVKQLISMGNYMEVMDSAEWSKHFAEGISHPKKTLEFMWKNAPFLEARFGRGYAEAINRAMDEANKAGKLKNDWAKAMTSLVRMGDIGAIIYGGYPVVQAELAKGKSMKQAVAAFEQATLQAQQSGLASSRSQFQNSSNPFARLFLAFKNTANQYLRKQVDAIISYHNGDITKRQLAKTLAIYGIIQPALYGMSSIVMGNLLYGGDEDEGIEDWAIELFNYMAVAPVNALPLINDMVKAALRKLTGQRIYKVFSTPLFDDLESGARTLTKKEVTIYDVLESVGTFAEPITGAPIKTYTRIGKKFIGQIESKGR